MRLERERAKDLEAARSFIVTDPNEENDAYEALIEKYNLQMHLVNLLSWISGRIKKRSVIRIEIV